MKINKKNKKDLEFYIETLNYYKYSDSTISNYSFYLIEFLNKINKYSYNITANDFDRYLKEYNFSSTSKQNIVISSIKFYYDNILKKKYKKVDFKRPRKEKKIPKIIDNSILINNISNIKNLKHKAILSLGYLCGLRVSEVVNLKIVDIDSKRMILNINNSKGNKDRIVPINIFLLELLRKYYKNYKPNIYLFNGQIKETYSKTSCNKLIKKYIGEKYTYHQLRHSYATFLLESGIDIRIIQKLLGHENSKTTEIYTHVSNNIIKKIQLPKIT